jgi:PPM family protein phosphatase
VTLSWDAAGATHVGRVRQGNEDSFLVDAARGVFLVADGMGGHVAGEIASALATEAVGGTLRDGVDRRLRADDLAAAMVQSFLAASRAIQTHVAENPHTDGMGTTLTACALCDDGTYRLGHIGDSRAYRFRDGELVQITRDHTWVQQQVDDGRLTHRQARRHHLAHVVTRALGAGSDDAPDVLAGTLHAGDLLLFTTDGLTNMVPDADLADVLATAAGTSAPDALHGTLETLIDAANARGGPDNVTAVIVRLRDGATGAG